MFQKYLIFIGFFALIMGKCYGAEEGMPQLNPEYWVSQIVWLILTFGFLYIILWKAFLPKITQNLENRKTQILSDLDNAQKFRDQSEKKILEYNKIIDLAKQEAKKKLYKTRKKINSDIENKKKNFDSEIEKEIQKTEEEIKILKLSSIKHINEIAIEISSEVVRKMMNTEVNTSNISAIVNEVSKSKLQNIYDN